MTLAEVITIGRLRQHLRAVVGFANPVIDGRCGVEILEEVIRHRHPRFDGAHDLAQRLRCRMDLGASEAGGTRRLAASTAEPPSGAQTQGRLFVCAVATRVSAVSSHSIPPRLPNRASEIQSWYSREKQLQAGQ